MFWLELDRTYLKNVFWPNIFVGASLQILNIQQYASGLKLGPAAILNQNPIFEIGSSNCSFRGFLMMWAESQRAERRALKTGLPPKRRFALFAMCNAFSGFKMKLPTGNLVHKITFLF